MMSDARVSFDSWYRQVHAELSVSLLVSFGDADLACEAADEAIARAFERWERVSTMGSPGGWTYQVAFNIARRKRRRRSFEAALVRRHRSEPIPGPAGELWQLVRELPERQRVAIVFRHVAGMTEIEIGQAMGIARGTVSATLRHAYRSLRQELEEERDCEETRL